MYFLWSIHVVPTRVCANTNITARVILHLPFTTRVSGVICISIRDKYRTCSKYCKHIMRFMIIFKYNISSLENNKQLN